MSEPALWGYTDRLSVAPGEVIEFKVSSDRPGVFNAEVVRLVNGDTNPAGPGFQTVPAASVNGDYRARRQLADPGSYVVIEDGGALAAPDSFTLHAFLFPTTPEGADQIILGRYRREPESGYALALRDGRVTLLLAGGGRSQAVQAEVPLHGSCWYSVAVSFDAANRTARLYVRSVVSSTNSLLSPAIPIRGEADHAAMVDVQPEDSDSPFLIAGATASAEDRRVDAHFNGKVDSPSMWSRALSPEELDAITAGGSPPTAGLIAAWDFADGIRSDGIPGDRVVDAGPHHLDGRCVQFPARAVTGWKWRGVEEHFIHAPDQYSAVHFHEDDCEDCGWDTDLAWTIPGDLQSGVYALHLQHDDLEDWVPFFVLPPRGVATSKVLLLVPTASYLAYANERFPSRPYSQALFGRTAVIDELTLGLFEHMEFGQSTYDVHTDGSGVHYSSALRPIINMRPTFRASSGGPWQLPADLHLVAWLAAKGIEYDVATDRELHDEGAALLGRYNVVMTGSHPEYYSREMLDGWEEYLGAGGRGMYLGGNGFYWIIGWHPDKPHLMEIRRGELGSRAWQARPGEYYLQTNGERSGLWRGRARAPQKNFGTGFAAQGFDASTYFVQLPDALDARAAFIMSGIANDERIGDFGLIGDGAAGSEVDRYELALGTPPDSLLLASSEGLSDNYPRVPEELPSSWPAPGAVPSTDPNVRADIVYFTTRNGGGVFSTSSIAWCGSLLESDCANNVSQMTENVLRRFMEDDPLPSIESDAVRDPDEAEVT